MSEENKLYGSVSARDIVDGLAAMNIEIEKKMVILEEPIKTLGACTVPIRIYRDVTAEITVEVLAQE